MTEKQLKEIIKAKELELKQLKEQLKEMQVKEESTDYSKIDYSKENLSLYSVEELIKICKQNNIKVISKKKEKLVNSLVEIIEARNNKGWAFKN